MKLKMMHLGMRFPVQARKRRGWISIGFFILAVILSLQAYAQEPRIADIQVQGTSDLEIAQILFSLESQIREPLDQRKISRDIHTIYEMKLFQDVHAEVSEDERGYILTFVVKERPRVTGIHIQGRKIISQKDIQEAMTLKKMDIYDPVKVKENEGLIANVYRKNGYARVQVTSSLEQMTENDYVVTFVINESPRSYLTDITIKGTEVFSELAMKRFMISAEIDCFSWINESGIYQEERINQDLALIAQHYLKNGYIKVFIQKPDVTLYRNPEYSRLEVRMDIKEGPQYFAGKIDISGDILGEKEKLMEILRLKEGDVYNPFLQNQDRSRLNEAYQEQGYAFVRVVPRTNIHDDTRTVDVDYHIVKKEKAYIGRLDIAGNSETRDYVIRREFEVGEDELFNGKKLRLSQENLSRLGFFESGIQLDQDAREDEDNLLDIITRLKETQTGSFQAQLGYSDQSRLSGGLSLSKGNLFGRGQTLRLSMQFSEADVRRDYNITFIEPRLWGSQTSSSFTISHKTLGDQTELSRGELTENTYSMGLGYPLYRNLRFSTSFTAVDRLFKRNISSVIKRSVGPTLTYNTVNHPVFPSEGIKVSGTVEHTGTPFGGNAHFREYQTIYQEFWSLNEERTLILMARARFGQLQKLGDFEIPAEDRYRIGGINSVRGFRYFSIAGPFAGNERIRHTKQKIIVNELGEQQIQVYDNRTTELTTEELQELSGGGISQRIFNLELVFPLSQDEQSFVRGVLFVDGGNVNAESRQYELLGEKEPELFDLRRGAGGGVRLITPVGVLRFEYGFKLDRRRGESPDRFEFNISGLF